MLHVRPLDIGLFIIVYVESTDHVISINKILKYRKKKRVPIATKIKAFQSVSLPIFNVVHCYAQHSLSLRRNIYMMGWDCRGKFLEF